MRCIRLHLQNIHGQTLALYALRDYGQPGQEGCERKSCYPGHHLVDCL